MFDITNRISHYIGNNKSFLHGALFAVFSFINRGFSFLLLLILANYIAPTGYGYLSLFTTVMMLLGYFMAFSTEGYFSVVYFTGGIEESKKVFTNIFFISFLVLAFSFIILFIWGNELSSLADLPLHCLFLALVTVFFNVFVNTNLELLRVKEKVSLYGVFSCSNALLNFIITIVLVRSFQIGWEGRVYSLAGCSSLYGLYAIIFFFCKGYVTKVDFKVLKTMLFWGIPLIPHLATNFIKQGCDRYIINYFHSTADVGIFSFALNLTTLITMIGIGFNQSNSVSIYKVCGSQSLSNDDKQTILYSQRRKYLLLYLFCSVIVVVLCLVLVPFLLPKYVDSLSYLPILGIYGLLVCCYLVYTNYLFFYNRTKTLMFITFGSAVLHLLLSLLLTRFSLFYTSIIYCLSQAVVVLLVRRFALKAIEDNIGTNRF